MRLPPRGKYSKVIGTLFCTVIDFLNPSKLWLVAYMSEQKEKELTGFRANKTSVSSGKFPRVLLVPRIEQLLSHKSRIGWKKWGNVSFTVIVKLDPFQVPCGSM
jgi:hypothetical protein